MFRWRILAFPVLMTLAIGGCAPGKPVPPPAAASARSGPGQGTIVSVRPVVAPPSAASRILIAGISGHGDAVRAVSEFIVRTDDGRTLSLVQSNEANFRQGDRVALTAGARTRLARD